MVKGEWQGGQLVFGRRRRSPPKMFSAPVSAWPSITCTHCVLRRPAAGRTLRRGATAVTDPTTALPPHEESDHANRIRPGLGAPAQPSLGRPGRADKDDKPVEKVRQALDQPISIQIEKQTLTAAVDALSKKTKIPIVLDNLAIQQQLGFTPDQSNILVQLDLKDVKTRTALRTILAPYNLSFAVIGDTIVVTTEDAAAVRQMRQRVSVDLSKVELAAALRRSAGTQPQTWSSTRGRKRKRRRR